jgi:hypothetical protein
VAGIAINGHEVQRINLRTETASIVLAMDINAYRDSSAFRTRQFHALAALLNQAVLRLEDEGRA